MRAALATALLLVALPPNDIDPDVLAAMTRYLHFSSSELAELQSGKIVKHSNDSPTPGELAVAGAVRIQASKQLFLDRVRDIAHFKQGPDVLEIGRFSDPPSLQDLAALTVNKDDFDVRACRVGDCGVRLPADTIRQLRQEIVINGPDVQQRTAELFKQVILDDVVAYEKGEMTGRLLQFDDGDRPIRPEDEFDGLLGDTPSLAALVPGLPAHLAHYPASPLANAEDFLYWSKERFGIAPFITVTHVTIVCPSSRTCVMTTRDVYSSRYLDASLSLSIATDAATGADAFYLFYANRARANALKGGLAALRRALAGRRARGSLEETLKSIKHQLETAR